MSFRFRVPPGAFYQNAPCSSPNNSAATIMIVTAAEFASKLRRRRNPDVNSPFAEVFCRVGEFKASALRLKAFREKDSACSSLRVDEYVKARGVEGVRVFGLIELHTPEL